jgi:hypothetical protein
MRAETTPPQRAYLVRCWCEQHSATVGESSWRFSVEEIVPQRRRRGFGSLDALIAFLRAELADRTKENEMEAPML